MSIVLRSANHEQESSHLSRSVVRFSRFRLLICLMFVVLFLVVAAHWPVLRAKAIYVDDGQYYLDNQLVQNPSLRSARVFFSEVLNPSTVRGYYQPLTMISLMIDCALAGDGSKVVAFHRTSLVIHALNTGLIIFLLYLVFRNPWIAAGVGMLFGLHPLTVAEVAWISERKTLLAMFFSLWSLVLYVQWIRTPRPWISFGCLLCYLLGMLAKPTCITLPLLMVIMDFWPLNRLTWGSVIEKTLLFGLMGGGCIITLISQSRSGAGSILNYKAGVERVVLVVCHNIVFYLEKIVFPFQLSQYVPFPQPLAVSHPAVLKGVIGVCLFGFLLLISLRRTRAWFASGLMFIVALLPTMNIVQVSSAIACNRYIYLPILGVLLLLASIGSWIWENGRSASLGRSALIVIVLAIGAGEWKGTRRHLEYWRDSVSLCKHMLSIYPSEDELHVDMGNSFERAGNLDACISHYSQAMRINPNVGFYKYCLGNALLMRGETKLGIHYLREASEPRYGSAGLPALARLAWVFATHPDPNICNPKKALVYARRAVHQVRHENPHMLACLAAASAAGGQFHRATTVAERALRIATEKRHKLLVHELTEHLEFYRQGKPYQEDPYQKYQQKLLLWKEL